MPDLFKAIILGRGICGLLDGTAAITLLHFQGVGPSRVFQGVASGLIGLRSFQAGWRSIALGLLLHFSIALSAASIFSLASRHLPWLLSHTLTAGVLYGLIVYLVMSLIVVPLSARPKTTVTPGQIVSQIIVHALCVGLPISLATKHYLPHGKVLSQTDRHPVILTEGLPMNNAT